jgi:hypothetical protein
MRKLSMLLSVLVLAAMVLAACGGEETSTSVPTENIPPTTVESTATSEVGAGTATEVPTEVNTTGTPGTSGIPVTGAANSDRLSNELKFTVLDQSGQQVGKVDDMVLDLSKAKILYVVVSAEKKIAVPWAFLKLGTDSTSSNASGQPNAFILQTDADTFKNAPEFDLKNMPQLGESPDSWDISFRKYWSQGGGAASGNNTPSPAGTAVTDMTATATSTSNTSGTGTGNTTSTPAISAGASQGSGTAQGATSIQGVQLASKVLNAKVTVGMQSPGLGISTPGAGGLTPSTPSPSGGTVTSTPSTSGGTGLATSTSTSSSSTSGATSTPGTSSVTVTSTSTASSGGTGLATSVPSTGTKNVSATIDDMIVNADLGEIMYIVIKTSFEDGVHLSPVPLRLLKFDSENQAFLLDVDAAMLQNAPFFQSDQFPDMTTPGWNSEFDSFWQTNGSGGTGSQATPTP